MARKCRIPQRHADPYLFALFVDHHPDQVLIVPVDAPPRLRNVRRNTLRLVTKKHISPRPVDEAHELVSHIHRPRPHRTHAFPSLRRRPRRRVRRRRCDQIRRPLLHPLALPHEPPPPHHPLPTPRPPLHTPTL